MRPGARAVAGARVSVRVRRADWRAQPAASASPRGGPALHAFLASTRGAECFELYYCNLDLRRLQHKHMVRLGHPDIKYNFVIDGEGVIYEGRGWDACAILPKEYKKYEKTSILIGLFGNYRGPDVPNIMSKATRNLIDLGIQTKHLDKKIEIHKIFYIDRDD